MIAVWNEPGPDADDASGLRPRCRRCEVTIKGRWWHLRHRLFVCDPWRVHVKHRIHARAAELYAQEEPW